MGQVGACAQRGQSAPGEAPTSPVSGHRSKHIQAYGLRELDDFQPFLNDLYAFGEAAGLAPSHIVSARGSFNLLSRYRLRR